MITTSVARPASRGPGGSRGRRRWPVVAVVAALVGALGVPTPASAAVPPGERQRHAMAASGPGKLVLFGGYGTTGDVKDDTWVWNGTAWQRQRPPTSPSPRYAHAMALYPPTGTVLLHGGLGIEIDFLQDTTWVWNPRAKTWTDVTPPSGSPTPG